MTSKIDWLEKAQKTIELVQDDSLGRGRGIGALKRCLEWAYRQGLAERGETSPRRTVDVHDIRAKAREICIRLSLPPEDEDIIVDTFEALLSLSDDAAANPAVPDSALDVDGHPVTVGDLVEVIDSGAAQRIGLRAKIHSIKQGPPGWIDLRWNEHPSGGANRWLTPARFVRRVDTNEASTVRRLDDNTILWAPRERRGQSTAQPDQEACSAKGMPAHHPKCEHGACRSECPALARSRAQGIGESELGVKLCGVHGLCCENHGQPEGRGCWCGCHDLGSNAELAYEEGTYSAGRIATELGFKDENRARSRPRCLANALSDARVVADAHETDGGVIAVSVTSLDAEAFARAEVDVGAPTVSATEPIVIERSSVAGVAEPERGSDEGSPLSLLDEAGLRIELGALRTLGAAVHAFVLENEPGCERATIGLGSGDPPLPKPEQAWRKVKDALDAWMRAGGRPFVPRPETAYRETKP